MNKLEKLKRHFDKYLLIYVALVMVGGLLVGAPFFKEIASIKDTVVSRKCCKIIPAS